MPSDQLWNRIDAALAKEKIKKPFRVTFWLGVAALLMVLMAVVFVYSNRNRDKNLNMAELTLFMHKKEHARLPALSKRKRIAYRSMRKRIQYCMIILVLIWNKLDSDYERLKKELQNSPNQKVVVKAMVKNLKLQLQVINQQLSIINEVNQYKEENQI